MSQSYDRFQPYIERHSLTALHERRVVECAVCHLVQFFPDRMKCRRISCAISFKLPPVETPVEPKVPHETNASRVSPIDSLDGATFSLLRSLRKWSGMTQSELCRRMGVPRTYISKIESERSTPTIKTLERFAAAYCVPMNLFVTAVLALYRDGMISSMFRFKVGQLVFVVGSGVYGEVADMKQSGGTTRVLLNPRKPAEPDAKTFPRPTWVYEDTLQA